MAPGGASVSKFRKMGLKHNRNNSDVPCDCFIGEPNFGKLSSERRTGFFSIFLSASDLVCGVRSVVRCTAVYAGFSIMPVSCVALSPIASSAELRRALTSPSEYGGVDEERNGRNEVKRLRFLRKGEIRLWWRCRCSEQPQPYRSRRHPWRATSPLSKVRIAVLVVSARHFLCPSRDTSYPNAMCRDGQEPLMRGPQERDRGGVDFQNTHCSGTVSRVEIHGDNSKSHALFLLTAAGFVVSTSTYWRS